MVTYSELKTLEGKNVILVSELGNGKPVIYIGRFDNLQKPEKNAEDHVEKAKRHVATARFKYNRVNTEPSCEIPFLRSSEPGFRFKPDDTIYPYDLENLQF